MVLDRQSNVPLPCWNYLRKTPNVFEVNARESEGAMKKEQSRETGNKTQDEDKQSKIHNTILNTTMYKMKIEKKHNMCWTSPAQDVDKLNENHPPSQKSPQYVNYAQTNTNNVN
jgi:hypothetical protein